MEIQRNVYRVTYTDYTNGRTNAFEVVASSEQGAERYCKVWREMFDTCQVEILAVDVDAPSGVRQAFWNI